MTMNTAVLAAPARRTIAARAKESASTHLEIAARSLRRVGFSDDALQPQFLARYAELKRITAERLREWLEQRTPEELFLLRCVFEEVFVDCAGELSALTAEEFVAAGDQLKLVPQFFGDGSPFGHFRLPKLNTVDAIDDALGADFVPALGVAKR
jgi:hypothetical protein